MDERTNRDSQQQHNQFQSSSEDHVEIFTFSSRHVMVSNVWMLLSNRSLDLAEVCTSMNYIDSDKQQIIDGWIHQLKE